MRPPMCAPNRTGSAGGYARFIGRVGALAILLGVGTALASPAIADTTDGSGASTGASTAESSDAPATANSDGADESTPAQSSSDSSTDEATQSSTDSTAPDPRSGVVQASGGANTTVTAPAEDSDDSTPDSEDTEVPAEGEDEAEGEAEDPPATEAQPADTPARAERDSSTRSGTAATSTSDAPETPADTLTSTSTPPVTEPDEPEITGTTTDSTQIMEPGDPSAVVAENVPVSPKPATPSTFVTSLISTVLGMNPLVGHGPAAPPESPALWALLAWARRDPGTQTPYSSELRAQAATELVVDDMSVADVPAAAATAADLAASQVITSLIPYTVAALTNAVEMVLEHPVQVLLRPFEAITFVAGSIVRGFLTDIGVLPALPYADTGWPTLHGDPGNRKQQLGVTPADLYNRWEALAGASVLAAPTILPNGNIAVTTGLAAGASNLHVFDKDGNLVWQSDPWDGQQGVDSAAVLSSPIVDRNGNIFVSDGDQLWSFTQDGDVRWVSTLPSPPADNPFAPGSRNINPFITATLTNDGSVFGVTAFGQVVVVNGRTGQLAAPVYQIPGELPPPTTMTLPPTLWAGGYMDPEIIDPVYQVAFGGIVRSANTPAVDTKTGRIFVAATDAETGKGALYGFDYAPATPFGPGEIKVAFSTQMGPGSGSSPTLSPDGKVVYASDDAGLLYAFDTRTGNVLWTTQSNAEAASVAVDGSGNIYVLTRGSIMSAFSPQGEALWEADVSELLQQELPVSPILGAPVAIGGGNPTVVNGAIVQAVVYGYNVPIQGRMVLVPVKAAIVAFDPATGVGVRTLAYTTSGTEGILNIGPDGRIFASLGAFTTTSVGPLAPFVNPLLPEGLTMIPPNGGLNVFTPQI